VLALIFDSYIDVKKGFFPGISDISVSVPKDYLSRVYNLHFGCEIKGSLLDIVEYVSDEEIDIKELINMELKFTLYNVLTGNDDVLLFDDESRDAIRDFGFTDVLVTVKITEAIVDGQTIKICPKVNKRI